MGRRNFGGEHVRDELVAQTLQLREADVTQNKIADQLGVSQSTGCVGLKSYGPPKIAPQQQVADKIRGQLVCCNIFQRLKDAGPGTRAWAELRGSADYHANCYFGEWAARIAEAMAS